MSKISNAKMQQITCVLCGVGLAWTAPGEVERIKKRAVVYCDECKSRPPLLTERQAELLRATSALSMAEGRAPTFEEIGKAMEPPASKSRVQGIVFSVRKRGYGKTFEDALYAASALPLDTTKLAARVPDATWADVGY